MEIERLLKKLERRYPTEEEIEQLLNAGVDPCVLGAKEIGEEETELEFYKRHFAVK